MNPQLHLRNGGSLVGSWVSTGSPAVAELMAQSGFDFLCIDAEHSPISISDTAALFRAIRSGRPSCTPFVRIPGIHYAHTKRYLDAGALGIIAPLVNTRKQAESLVAACKYPPAGNRGIGYCRANNYGRNLAAYVSSTNDEVVLAVQIEHAAALTQLDDILSVPGIDAAFVGPYDLSASLGHLGNLDHPDCQQALNQILDACLRSKIAPGIHITRPHPTDLNRARRDGYRLLAYSLDITILADACDQAIQRIRRPNL